jgi:aspartyl-tRNA synthetase
MKEVLKVNFLFPKTGSGYDPVFKSPSKSSEAVLKDYGLKAIVGGGAKEAQVVVPAEDMK